MSKIYKTEQETREIIDKAVNKLCDFIRVTYGPASNKIIIEKVRSVDIIDDGVETARNFELPDECENAVIRVIREAAQKTNDRVGDGTTSSLIMLQALMKEIKDNKRSAREIIIELQKGLEDLDRR